MAAEFRQQDYDAVWAGLARHFGRDAGLPSAGGRPGDAARG
jgi:hypothetical protein